MSYKRILVPVDGSRVSGMGLKQAVRIARAGKAKLRLLHVCDEHAAYLTIDATTSLAPMLDALRAAAKRTLAGALRRARAMGIQPSTVLVENFGGRVADAIVREARRWRPDLIVMGTHGRRGVKRMLLGSDAELVIRQSPVPVLLVPGRKR